MKEDDLKKGNEIKREMDELKEFYEELLEMDKDWKYLVSVKLKRWNGICGAKNEEILVPKSVEREFMPFLRNVVNKKIKELRDELSSL